MPGKVSLSLSCLVFLVGAFYLDMGELAKIESFCELSKTNLTFKREVSKDEWMDIFKALKQVEGCVQFWIGDCLAYRQQKWGMYDDIAEETGYSKEALKQYKVISEAIEPCTRVHELDYTHHVDKYFMRKICIYQSNKRNL